MRSLLPVACILLLFLCAIAPATSLHLEKGAPSLSLSRQNEGRERVMLNGELVRGLAEVERLKGGQTASYVQSAPVKSASGGALRQVLTLRNVAVVLVLATAASFYQVKKSQGGGVDTGAKPDNYAMGLFMAGVALFGNAGVSALRKMLSQHKVGSAQQVGLACLIQGVFAVGFCFKEGILKAGPEFLKNLPPQAFWGAAVGASALNSLVKTLETKAFAETDMSLCAPFLAFDPVMQFLVGVAIMPAMCRLASLGCDELKSGYPPYHILSVCCIAVGAFMLGGKPSGSSADEGGKEVAMLGPLPVGSWYILLNCVIYSFTSRMDKLAIKSSGKTLYYAYGRLLMAATTLGGSFASGALNSAELSKFAKPQALTLLLGICLADAVYMLSLYQAFALISPVYVTAVKRGGGILLSSLLGVLLFGESMAGRLGPILTIVIGVTFLCL